MSNEQSVTGGVKRHLVVVIAIDVPSDVAATTLKILNAVDGVFAPVNGRGPSLPGQSCATLASGVGWRGLRSCCALGIPHRDTGRGEVWLSRRLA